MFKQLKPLGTKISARMSTLRSIPKTSSFTAKLQAEPLIPSVKEAISLYQSKEEEQKLQLFNTPRIIKSGAFQFTIPTKRKKHQYLLTSPKALEELGFENELAQDEYYQKIVSGEDFYYDKDVFPYAQAYAGFQFGQFAGQLGDGRVVNLFEITNSSHKRYELQLKGAGKTAFSRFADGKAVLRSSIREFIVSETLNAIGIPSTRALSISYLPGTFAQRERAETCSIVARFSPSWIRVGTFDLYRWRKDNRGLIELSDYVIEEVLAKVPGIKERFLVPDDVIIARDSSKPTRVENPTKYQRMVFAISHLNGRSVGYWQAYGFMNGVLNTDNTSVIGLSMDFGPFSFLDKFTPDFTPNHDDHELRYSFSNQPSVIWWNLNRLAESMVKLIGTDEEVVRDKAKLESEIDEQEKKQVQKKAEEILSLMFNEYESTFQNQYDSIMRKRLGLLEKRESDQQLFTELLEILAETKVSFNSFYVNLELSNLDNPEIFLSGTLLQRFRNPEDKVDAELKQSLLSRINTWLKNYNERLSDEGSQRSSRIEVASRVNPRFIPSNWVLDEVIEHTQESKAQDLTYLQKLLKMSSNPFDKSKWGDELKQLESKWTADVDDHEKIMRQCSCSS